MYDLNTLKKEYTEVINSGTEESEQAFIDHLLEESAPEHIAWHYEILNSGLEPGFYYRLITAFVARGIVTGDFLLKQLEVEQRDYMQWKIIELLGWIKHPAARDLVLRRVQSPDTEMRRQACSVLSWVGTAADLEVLKKLLFEDPEQDVRTEAAMSLSEWVDNLPEQKSVIIDLLIQALILDNDSNELSWEKQETIAWLVISAQVLSGLEFGLSEVWDTIGFEGDVLNARKQCLRALM
jgi:hypothetical protein